MKPALLLLDVGNTQTHAGLADRHRVRRIMHFPTADWGRRQATDRLRRFVCGRAVSATALCTVVPPTTPAVLRALRRCFGSEPFVLNHRTVAGIGVDYPKPATIGPDRLANAIAARHRFGAPVIVIDFGTAVTFDVVDAASRYRGGIIAPGLAAMTDYLHEKTALLPRIRIREVRRVIGRSTREAMMIGAVHGYRGLIRGLLSELRQCEELRAPRLPVVATGGCAALLAARVPEILAVQPDLTLEGLRLAALAHPAFKSALQPSAALSRLSPHEPHRGPLRAPSTRR